ncbi:MAG: hypothetical protein AAF514_10580 [Verrucomicrobiota bacterium]
MYKTRALTRWAAIACSIGAVQSSKALDLVVEASGAKGGETSVVTVRAVEAVGVGFLLFDLAFPSDALELENEAPGSFLEASGKEAVDQDGIYVTSERSAVGGDGIRRNIYRFAWVQPTGFTGSAKIVDLTFKATRFDERSEVALTLIASSAFEADSPNGSVSVAATDATLSILVSPTLPMVVSIADILRDGEEVVVQLNGTPDGTVTVETSGDLKNWGAATTATLDAEGRASVRVSTPKARTRFVRIRTNFQN